MHMLTFIRCSSGKSEAIHETGLSGNVVASFFPLIIFIYIYFLFFLFFIIIFFLQHVVLASEDEKKINKKNSSKITTWDLKSPRVLKANIPPVFF